MCGRTCCALCPATYQKATSYLDLNTDEFVQPEWLGQPKSGLTFRPSSNIAPTDVTPVLVMGSNIKSESNRVIAPMVWSMIPPWHKGEFNKHGLQTSNCRVEGIMKSKLYGPCLRRGKRCVVVCEGFYEWQSAGSGPKKPFFLYDSTNKNTDIDETSLWADSNWSSKDGWKGPKLLHMAGVFNEWISPKDEEIRSYSVLTMDSNKDLKWLHSRMPAVLNTPEEVQAWLNHEDVSASEALAMLTESPHLMWYPVSTVVNNSKNKTEKCNKRLPPEKKKTTLDSWFKTGSLTKRLPDSGSGSQDETKRFKENV